MPPLIISSAIGQPRVPKPRPPKLLQTAEIESFAFLCPCARSQYRFILSRLWTIYHSSPPASEIKQDTKKEIFVLTRKLGTKVVLPGIENHKGKFWRLCQAEPTGLITRDIARISTGQVFLILVQGMYLAQQRKARLLCKCRRCQCLDKRPLLQLPAELRNHIYQLALLVDQRIYVDSTWRQPTLLRVNRQIRQEASSIYYVENTFSIALSDLDCEPYRKFITKTGLKPFYGKLAAAPGYDMWAPAMNWDNFLSWLHLYYQGLMPAMGPPAPNQHRKMKVTSRAFSIVSRLKAGGMPWLSIEFVLLEYKAAVEEQANGAWVWV